MQYFKYISVYLIYVCVYRFIYNLYIIYYFFLDAKNLKSEWKDTVFLHPTIMRECNIENLVLIKGEQKQILCVAYPVGKLKKNMVVFPKGDCPFKYQESVMLHKYEGEVKCANEIFITFANEKDVSESTKEYILRLLSEYHYYYFFY